MDRVARMHTSVQSIPFLRSILHDYRKFRWFFWENADVINWLFLLVALAHFLLATESPIFPVFSD